jgi:hypothetical protein
LADSGSAVPVPPLSPEGDHYASVGVLSEKPVICTGKAPGTGIARQFMVLQCARSSCFSSEARPLRITLAMMSGMPVPRKTSLGVAVIVCISAAGCGGGSDHGPAHLEAIGQGSVVASCKHAIRG